MTKRKIGWQKYEDVLEQQLKSPIAKLFMQAERSIDDKGLEDEYEDDEEEDHYKHVTSVAISESLVNEAGLASSFDCWVGHTNFGLTKSVIEILNKVEGIEILKVNTRYRFFIGVGKMFDSKDVKRNVEERLLSESN